MSGRLLQMSGIVVDLMYSVEAVPRAGGEAIVSGFGVAPGGGFNAMVAAKRAGMEVYYGGALGTGVFAEITRAGLAGEGIPSLRCRDTKRDQGCCTVMIDKTGERTFLAGEGAEAHATPEDMAKLNPRDFDLVLLSGYALHYEGSRHAIGEWLERDAGIGNLVFDPSPVVAAIPENILAVAIRHARWISANRQEAEYLTGYDDPMQSAKALLEGRPPGGGVVIRDGSHGCVLATADGCDTIAPFRVVPVDTNGAGDTHIGSFAAKLAEGDAPREAARYANTAAALSTLERGPATAPDNAGVIAAMATGTQKRKQSASRATKGGEG